MNEELVMANTILRGEVGSRAHGLAVGSDDRDEMGVSIEPPEYVIGLRRFEQYVHRTQPEGVRSQPGDLDLTIYSLRKWCSLALKGNPSILLLLFVPPERVVSGSLLGDRLRELAWAFASRRAGMSFLGYMEQQRERLMGERGQMKVNRLELVEAHGYDTKYAGHIVRLGFQGIEYMQTGALALPMLDPEREYVLAVRRGEVPLKDVLKYAMVVEGKLRTAIDTSPLPPDPNYEAVNEFLIDAYREWWGRTT